MIYRIVDANSCPESNHVYATKELAERDVANLNHPGSTPWDPALVRPFRVQRATPAWLEVHG